MAAEVTGYLMAVDPGTIAMGLSWWDLTTPESDPGPAGWALLRAADRDADSADRMVALRDMLDALIAAEALAGRITHVAIEQLRGRGVHPAPELDAWIRVLRRWASRQGATVIMATPRTWQAGILPKGMHRRAPQMPGENDGEAIKSAVAATLAARYPRLAAELPQSGVWLNVSDAVGLGLWASMRVRFPRAAELERAMARRR